MTVTAEWCVLSFKSKGKGYHPEDDSLFMVTVHGVNSNFFMHVDAEEIAYHIDFFLI